MSNLNTGLLLGLRAEARKPSLIKTEPSRQPVWLEGEGHLITVAPTGAGKGVSCIIPALLTWDGPAIVIDPKGENYAVTAKRRMDMGQRVHVLDPFEVTDAPHRAALNPFDIIRRGTRSAADDAFVLVDLCMQGRMNDRDPYWDERASQVIGGTILGALRNPRRTRNLGEVRRRITNPNLNTAAEYHDLVATGSPDAQEAAELIYGKNMPGNTRACIMSCANSHLSFIRDGAVEACLAESTIRLRDVIEGKPMTIYLVLPPDKLRSHSKLLRVWLGVFLTALARRKTAPSKPTLLLMDEAAQLGRLDALRTALTLMRGYGVKVWSFWQDMSQLAMTYPADWQSLLNNCAVQQFFGPASPFAATVIEAYLAGCAPRPLMQLGSDESVLVQSGKQPEIVRRPNYLFEPMFAGLAEPNPFHTARQLALPIPANLGPNVIPFGIRR